MSSRAIVRREGQSANAIVWPGTGESGPHSGPSQGGPRELGGADEAIEQAREAGYRAGLAAGREEAQAGARAEAQAQLQPLLERVARACQELAALRPRLREQAEADLVRLAVAIARRVVRRELTIDPQAIRGLIQAALNELAVREVSRVRVHPEFAQMVRSLLGEAGRENAIEVLADPAMERGGVLFETAHGNLDASVETQLAEIERGLTDRFRRPA